jgi:hypothetical protein
MGMRFILAFISLFERDRPACDDERPDTHSILQLTVQILHYCSRMHQLTDASAGPGRAS